MTKRRLVSVHEATALAGLVAIAVHGITLLGDAFIHPTLAQIAVPFTLDYRPGFTGLGIIAGWLAVFLGLSFYARRWIGAKRWRSLHRATIARLGAGRDPHARRRAPTPRSRGCRRSCSSPACRSSSCSSCASSPSQEGRRSPAGAPTRSPAERAAAAQRRAARPGSRPGPVAPAGGLWQGEATTIAARPREAVR